jgi:acetylornithine deacetylase
MNLQASQDLSSNTLSILRDLVAFDSTSYRSNFDLIDYVRVYLEGFNIQSEVIFNEDQNKANLLAKIGSGFEPAIVLSGHTDVVPVGGQNWLSDPFSLTVREGRAYGRGTSDMKGFIASVLAAVPAMVKASLSRPVYIALSYDEEVGCAGVPSLIDFIAHQQIEIATCIIGEPSSLKPVTAHTGKHVYTCQFHGTPMHSSLAPEGVNAISYAGRVIAEIENLVQIAKTFAVKDTRFTHPYPTLNIGRISGGKAVNIVAEHCQFDVECRYPPGSSADFFTIGLQQIMQSVAHLPMQQKHPSACAICEETVSYPAFSSTDASPAAQLVRRLTGANESYAVNYGTEAGLFEKAGFSSVVCGPGDIAQAHQPNEFIALSQLTACDNMLNSLLTELSVKEAMS